MDFSNGNAPLVLRITSLFGQSFSIETAAEMCFAPDSVKIPFGGKNAISTSEWVLTKEYLRSIIYTPARSGGSCGIFLFDPNPRESSTILEMLELRSGISAT